METAEEAGGSNEHQACSHCQGRGEVPRQKDIGAAVTAGQERATSEPTLKDGWLTMRQAAAKLRCGYCYFSGKWREWGLHPTKVGQRLFNEKELEELLMRRRISHRGRPRKKHLEKYA